MSGAIDTETGLYTLPRQASKKKIYTCLCHNAKLILKQGTKNKHHGIGVGLR